MLNRFYLVLLFYSALFLACSSLGASPLKVRGRTFTLSSLRPHWGKFDLKISPRLFFTFNFDTYSFATQNYFKALNSPLKADEGILAGKNKENPREVIKAYCLGILKDKSSYCSPHSFTFSSKVSEI